MTVIHHVFTIERRYDAAVDRVFAAWSDPQAKRRWFAGDNPHELDFRIGGTEVVRGRAPDGGELIAESRYHDVVPDERIVYSTTLSNGSTLATVSITTVEFDHDDAGTTLLLTESDVFLDGHELPAWREQGTSDWLGKLAEELAR